MFAQDIRKMLIMMSQLRTNCRLHIWSCKRLFLGPSNSVKSKVVRFFKWWYRSEVEGQSTNDRVVKHFQICYQGLLRVKWGNHCSYVLKKTIYAQPSSLRIGKVIDCQTSTTMGSLPNVSLGEGNPLLGFLGSIVNEPRLTKGETLAQIFLRLTRMMT